MPYGERMLFLLGVGIALVGIGWFCLTRIELAPATGAPPEAPADTLPVEQDAQDTEPADAQGESVAGEPAETSSALEGEAPALPELPPVAESSEAATPDPVESAPVVEEAATEEAPVPPETGTPDESTTTAYPLPDLNLPKPADGRDAPIQMILVDKTEEVVASEQGEEVPQEVAPGETGAAPEQEGGDQPGSDAPPAQESPQPQEQQPQD
ncbi:MAG: hypothetical protein RLZZ303_252 [Candidatus Hydrogenedentota bacterium]|jgi:hypothetical protein